MNKKAIILIICLICIALSFSTATAADAGESDANETLSVSVSESVDTNDNLTSTSIEVDDNLQAGSGGGSFSDLDALLHNRANEYKLTQNYTYNPETDSAFLNGISITSSITIDGDGYTIDGNGQARIFDINAPNIILKNIRFINGYSTQSGGAIYVEGDDTLEIINCNFMNNTVGVHGGAIYLENSNASKITSCYFANNTAGVNGGAVDWHKGATHGELFGSNFVNNTAKRSGGAVFWYGVDGDIKDSNFTNNKALGIAMGQSTYGYYSTGGDGGAVMWTGHNGDIINSRFIGNNASRRGGAVFMQGASDENCDNLTIDLSTFEDNYAGVNGGAVDWYRGAHDGKLYNSTFKNNTAMRSGGAVYWYGTDGEIRNVSFTDNKAYGLVDAPSSYGYNTTGGDGGAVMWTGSNGVVDNSTFINNWAAARGGAVFLQGSVEGNCTNTTFTNSYFRSNTAETNGGAIDWYEGAHDGIVDNLTFIDNTAKRNGGAIFWHGINGIVRNSNFINNRATGEALQYNMTLSYSDIILINSNVLPTNMEKGKLYVLNYTENGLRVFKSYTLNDTNEPVLLDEITTGAVTISPVDWAIDQFFGGDGGSILWSGDIGLVENCNFIESNSARRGGAAYMTGSDYVTYNNCNFTNTTSGTNGGGVDWLAGANNGKIYNCVFNNTRAARSAGAIYYDGWYGEMKNITIINATAYGGSLKTSRDGKVKYAGWDSSHWDTNTTGGDGGAIMITGNHEYLYNMTFIDCTATSRGGAVFLQDNDNVTFELCNFTSNRALGTANNTYYDRMDESSGFNPARTGHGGAIGFDIGNSLGVVKDSYFYNNTAARNGGAISFAEGSSNGKVYNSVFIDNTAGRSGGAFYWEGTEGNVSYCNFTNNDALGTSLQYDLTLTLDNIKVVSEKPENTELNTLYVINQTVTDGIHYESWVYVNKNGENRWLLLDQITIINDTCPSPQDWGIDQFFGGDGGTILWSGNIGYIDNCNFYNSDSARRGGAAYMTGGDHVEFTNCYFENCTSGTNGGGVDWLAGANYGKVINCTFNNTRAARSAGAIYYDGDYGEMKNITIINATSFGGSLKTSKDGLVKYAGWDSSHWDTNTTGGDAGAIMITGDHLYIYNATFTNCTSVGRGGAVFLQDNKNATFELCKFESNYAEGVANNTWANYTQERNDANSDTKVNYKLTGHGGAVAFDVNAKDCKIIDSKFYNNLARRNGGAINFDEGSTNNNITHCEFTNNTVYDDGGAINFDHGADLCGVYDSTFYNNTALGRFGSTSKGGTICLVGNNVTIQNSTFTLGVVYANIAEGAKDNETWGGAMFITGNYTIIKNCTFDRCNSIEDGGAIYVIGDDCKLYNSTFTKNSAGDDGGAIYWTGEDGLMYNITCIINSATGHTLQSSRPKGGTICLTGNNALVTKSHFEMSSAIVDGGAIYATGNYVNITESTFFKCNVTFGTDNQVYGGGSIYVLGDFSNIINCSFDRSNAKRGGIIYIQGNNVTIDNATALHSFADYGGSIYVRGANSTIVGSNLTMGNATYNGGAIYILGENTNITGTYIGMCIAYGDGGAIFVNGTNANIEKSTITMANATGYNVIINKKEVLVGGNGGSIYILGNDASIIDTNLSRSHAKVNGGIIYIAGQNAIVNGSSLMMCSADENGGAIYVAGFNATIENSTFGMTNASGSVINGVHTNGNGGAIYVQGDSASIIDSRFNITIAVHGSGGAIYVGGLNTNISGINASISQAPNGQGGLIYVDGVNTTISDSDLTIAHAGKEGGSVYIKGDYSKIINSTITRTSSDTYGGAVYIDAVNATIEDSHFAMNNATVSGGAIYILGVNANVKNSTFNLTFARTSPTSYATTNLGGAIYIKGNNANISFSNFTNSFAYQGGIIYLESNYCTIVNSTFDKGFALWDGGAIFSYLGAHTSLSNSTFTNNLAEYDGGAIFWHGGESSVYNSVDRCTFINNTAVAKGSFTSGTRTTRGGGALYWSEKGSYGSVTNSKFINNSVQAIKGKADGGAILWDTCSHGIIDNCTFYGNFITTEDYDGNGIWVQGGAMLLRPKTNFTLSNSIFENSWSDKEGGALYVSNKQGSPIKPIDVKIINVTFINNTALSKGTSNKNIWGGGAVQVKECDYIYLIDCKFINNTANIGGGVSFKALNGNNNGMINCTFIGNNATILNSPDANTVAGSGGAIWTDASKIINLENITMIGGFAVNYGGGLYSKGTIIYDTFTFINNTAGYGGGLYWDKGSVTISNMEFINNTATQFGGAIYIPQQSTTVSFNNFTGNTALSGGAIYANNNYITVSNNNFTNNTATDYGGAVYVALEFNANNVVTSRNVFTSNSAQEGGAIYIPIAAKGVAVTYSSFIKNHALNGGAIYLGSQGFKNRYVENCEFINNTAEQNGGAVYIANINQKILSCNFYGNNATLNGGAVYTDTGLSDLEIKDSTFKNSHANNGGAIYNDAGPLNTNLKINNDTFIKNIAVRNGGAVLYISNNGLTKYRDYNNFDGLGVPASAGRTNLKDTDTNTQFISTSLFEYNQDYILRIKTESDMDDPYITVYIDNPRDSIRRFLNVTIKLVDATTGEEVREVNITTENYVEHYSSELGIYATFSNLKKNQTYNITVGFSDENYMYKQNFTFDTAHGELMGDFQRLQRLIEQAISRGLKDDGAYHVSLPRAYTFDDEYDKGCMNLTDISHPIIIDGHDYTVNALGFSRIFYITSNDVTFKNIHFARGNASGIYNKTFSFGNGELDDNTIGIGGSLYWAGKNGALLNSSVSNSYAVLGGGIYFNASASDCVIYGTSFTNNNATTNGGAIDCNASNMELINTTFDSNYADYGAALCREINATFGHGHNNIFSNNYAQTAGAALAWLNASSISINQYYFYNNGAGFSGGAIYVGEGSLNCNVSNCVFEDNYVANEDTQGHGGAIEWYSQKGTIVNSTFARNRAFDGGALYVGVGSTEIKVITSNFTHNYAKTTGGAISIVASAVTINASNFYYNNATRGGALFVGGEGTANYIYSSLFQGNVAKGQTPGEGLGGAINWVASSGYLNDTKFISNCADYGGGLFFGGRSDESRISGCEFIDNHAKYNGGAIDCNASKMFLSHTIFDGNYAQFGAALCREINAQSGSGENNTFKNNHAYVSGAALGWMGSVGIKITNYTFINNSADVSGGAIYVSPDSHNCSIIDCNFENNYVTNKTINWLGSFDWNAWDGSPMYYSARGYDEPSQINKTIQYTDHTTYYYNQSSSLDGILGVGGAIVDYAANATIVNTKFTKNTARLGGALYVGSYDGYTNINRSTFTNNIAYERGGAINLHASAVNVNSTKFYGNSAEDGAALYVGGVGTNNTVVESVFDGNKAKGYGGGIYWIAQAGVMDNVNFTNNAAAYGGGIYFNGRSANTNLTNVRFTGNNATKNGGAIDCNAANIGIYNITFTSNYAGEYGAALCRESGATNGHGTNNTFISNHAGISGAALAWLGVRGINITDYHFIDNTAGRTGGAIFVGPGSDNCIINMSYFTGNHIVNETHGHGGAIDIVGDYATLINSNFTQNSAHYGGAVWVESETQTTINNVTFRQNEAVVDGGAINLRASGVTMNDARFFTNIAGRSGGAVYVGGNGTTNTIYYSVFNDNQAQDHGGAIDWRASAGEIMFTNFTHNTAEYGGALYLNGVSSNSRIFNVIFKENQATKNGGAIDCNASMMGLNNTQFISNYAGEYGAALCREANATGGFGGNNTFISNEAGISGAALAWLGVDSININQYIFINNTAYSSGGAIYVRGDSPNCKVRNSYFDNNYVTDVRNGQGGAIDWIGSNGYIYNTTFKDSFAVNGGTLYVGALSDNMTIQESRFTGSRAVGEGGSIVLYGNNVNITKSNFTYSIGLTRGGAIAAHQSFNLSISECIFDHSVGAGYVDATNSSYGDGGALFYENANNLTIVNTVFSEVESHAMGTITAINASNSLLSNVTFSGMFALSNGGSIAWLNSDNVTIENSHFLNSGASYEGGSIYFNNTNAVVKNSLFNNTSTPWGNGGAIYINGNVTVDNSTFERLSASSDNAAGIYVQAGTSIISNSSFDGKNTIWIARGANATIANNNITGLNPNDDLIYLENDYDIETNQVSYAVWNDGNLTLDNNNFDYVTFNNGTIWSQTYISMLGNKTYNVTWMDEFTFWAEILDDTQNNHIISVDSLYATNDVHQEDGDVAYPMKYNRIQIPNLYYQGAFHLMPHDSKLKNYEYKNGTVNVKMPLDLDVSYVINGDIVEITARLSPKVKSNFTLKDEQIYFRLGDGNYYPAALNCTHTQEGEFTTWTLAIGKYALNNLSAGYYTVTAYHPGDEVHLSVENSTSFFFEKRDTWIKIVVENIVYGQYALANVTTNGNGTVVLSMNGRTERYELSRDGRYENGTYTLLVRFDTLYAPGQYTMSALYLGDDYYEYEINETTFDVFKRNVTITANASDIVFWEVEYINATLNFIIYSGETVNVTAMAPVSGYVKVSITPTQEYVTEIVDGVARFAIPNLFSDEYKNILVSYYGSPYYNANMTRVNFTVGPTDNLTVDVKVDNITYGDNAVVRVKVPSMADGNVTIYVDGIEWGTVVLDEGTAQLANITGLAGGDHIVNVTYNGGRYYAAKNSTNVTFNVAQNTDWKMTITADEHPYGENTTITIKTSPYDVSNRNLTIKIGNNVYVVNITNGTATFPQDHISHMQFMPVMLTTPTNHRCSV